jgi:hypothetical protein
VCYGYDTKAFTSNMYDDNILVGGGGSAFGFVWGLPQQGSAYHSISHSFLFFIPCVPFTDVRQDYCRCTQS